jgi:hypothetical protein
MKAHLAVDPAAAKTAARYLDSEAQRLNNMVESRKETAPVSEHSTLAMSLLDASYLSVVATALDQAATRAQRREWDGRRQRT